MNDRVVNRQALAASMRGMQMLVESSTAPGSDIVGAETEGAIGGAD